MLLTFICLALMYLYIALVVAVFMVGVVWSHDLDLDVIIAGLTMVDVNTCLAHLRFIVIGFVLSFVLFFFIYKYKKITFPIFFLFGTGYLLSKTNLFYIQSKVSIYDEYYKNTEISVKNKKKNIIYISLESFSDLFEKEKFMGENLIPNLTKLRREGLSFRGRGGIIGTWPTVPSYTSVMCGIPICNSDNFSVKDVKYKCIPDVLSDLKYDSTIIVGFYKTSENLNKFVLKHNYDDFIHETSIKRTNPSFYDDKVGFVPDYGVFELSKDYLKKQNGNFFLSIITKNTHGPNHGYTEKFCEKKYNNIKDAYLCLDKIVYDFVKWCEKQPFYKDTIIVLAGDHGPWDRIFTSNNISTKNFTNSEWYSEPYNVFLNTGITDKVIYKPHTMYDFASTIFELAGITLTPRTFGLGRTLLSDIPTVLQIEGYDSFENKIKKSIADYNRKFL